MAARRARSSEVKRTMYRYAVYYAPERHTQLWQAGCAWLGRDPESGAVVPTAHVRGLDAALLRNLTEDPRRYGFPATLKPPFRPVQGADFGAVAQATAGVAARLSPFAAPPLVLSDLDGVLALTLGADSPAMQKVADEAVVKLDQFRAPPSAAELARRRAPGLAPQEEALLAKWGYPYMMERFRFHITLTSRLTPAQGAIVGPELERRFSACLGVPLPVADIVPFWRTRTGAPFRLMERFPLGHLRQLARIASA